MVWSHDIKNDLTNIKLLANDNGMNELSNWSLDLGTMGKGLERISEKRSDDPYWLGEANNGDIRRKGLIGTK